MIGEYTMNHISRPDRGPDLILPNGSLGCKIELWFEEELFALRNADYALKHISTEAICSLEDEITPKQYIDRVLRSYYAKAYEKVINDYLVNLILLGEE